MINFEPKLTTTAYAGYRIARLVPDSREHQFLQGHDSRQFRGSAGDPAGPMVDQDDDNKLTAARGVCIAAAIGVSFWASVGLAVWTYVGG